MSMTPEDVRTLYRIEEKVDQLHDMVTTHATRLGTVERRQWITIGAFAAASTLMLTKFKALMGL